VNSVRLHVRRFCVRKTDPWPFCCLLSIIFVSCVKNCFDVSGFLVIAKLVSYLIAANVPLRHGCDLCYMAECPGIAVPIEGEVHSFATCVGFENRS
jgi:hypothetical protein